MAQLDIKRIAKVALAVLDTRGISGFTMRAVANSLGVTPMALYNHVQDKAGLAALVIDTALSERPLSSPTGNWKEDLVAVAHWTRACTLAHPAVGELQRSHRIWSQPMLHIAERWLSLWQQSGLSHERALLAATSSTMAISGLAFEALVYREMVLPDDAMLALMPNARLLYQSKIDPEEMFELVVRSTIDGLHVRLSQNSEVLMPLGRRKGVRNDVRRARPKRARI